MNALLTAVCRISSTLNREATRPGGSYERRWGRQWLRRMKKIRRVSIKLMRSFVRETISWKREDLKKKSAFAKQWNLQSLSPVCLKNSEKKAKQSLVLRAKELHWRNRIVQCCTWRFTITAQVFRKVMKYRNPAWNYHFDPMACPHMTQVASRMPLGSPGFSTFWRSTAKRIYSFQSWGFFKIELSASFDTVQVSSNSANLMPLDAHSSRSASILHLYFPVRERFSPSWGTN